MSGEESRIVTRYIGYDTVLHLFSELRRRTSTKKYLLFYSKKNLELKMISILEGISMHIGIKSQYERYYKEGKAYPARREGSIYFSSTYETDRDCVAHLRPKPYDFTNKTLRFARHKSLEHVRCTCSNGKRTCPNCSGSGRVTCYDCGGSGKCTRCRGTGLVTCPKCGGSGKITCRKCWGSGKIRVTEQIRVTCPECGGRGYIGNEVCYTCGGTGFIIKTVEKYVTCPVCGGSGLETCPECGGSGKVTCPKCGGSGICPTCHGSGTLTCPTCHGYGKVTCPVCEGDGSLILFTVDVFRQYSTYDSRNIIPSEFSYYRKTIEDAMSDERYSVSIGSLDLDRIIDAVGIYNEIIKETYDRVVSEYGMLKDIVYSRVQGYRPIDDNYLKEKAFQKANRIIEENWRSTPSDNYFSKFKLKLSEDERTYASDTIYNDLLFRLDRFYVYPLSAVVFEINRKRRSILAVGTKESAFKTEVLLDKSPLKIALFILIILSALFLSVSLFGYDLFIVRALQFDLTLSILSGIIFSIAFPLYSYIIIRDKKAIDEHVLIIGVNDLKNLFILSLISNLISINRIGEVMDLIYSDMTRYLLTRRIDLGNSVACTIKLNKGYVRLISVSSSTLADHNQDLIYLMKTSKAVIIVIDNDVDYNAQVDLFNRVLSDISHGRIIIISRERIRGIRGSVVKIDIERLVSRYLSGEEISGISRELDEVLNAVVR